MTRLDDYNYFNDRRVCKPAPTSFEVYMGDEVWVDLPTYWEVCPICDGEGKHVNPSIDAGGLTQDDFDEDPDFRQNYLEGVYDIPCNYCGGKRVVKMVNTDLLSDDVAEAFRDQQRDDAEEEAIHRAELAMGC